VVAGRARFHVLPVRRRSAGHASAAPHTSYLASAPPVDSATTHRGCPTRPASRLGNSAVPRGGSDRAEAGHSGAIGRLRATDSRAGPGTAPHATPAVRVAESVAIVRRLVSSSFNTSSSNLGSGMDLPLPSFVCSRCMALHHSASLAMRAVV
jgi:hypothetical protein